MSFPQTRLTLIQRIASESKDEDWQQFLNDYWGPVRRFASRWGGLSEHDAEDVASQTFEALLRNQLLVRWEANRTAKLRSLLCQVVRNVLANQARVADGRKRRLQQFVEQGAEGTSLRVGEFSDPAIEEEDAFYSAWVEDLLWQAADRLMRSMNEENQGDRFRVLYGSLCEGLSIPQISQALLINITTAENYLKAARKQLTKLLEELVEKHVQRYVGEGNTKDELQREWGTLGDYLKTHGGLDAAMRRVYNA